MMIVVVVVMLASSGGRGSNGIGATSLGGESAGETEASAGRESASAGGAGAGGLVGFAGGRKVLRGGVARHAMDGFHGCGYGLGIRLRPAKAAGEPLKKIVNSAGFELLVLDVVPRLLLPIVLLMGQPLIFFWFLRTARVRGFGHGNLMFIVAIVGEFAG